MNRRETLALHRLSLMRLRMRAANQRRLAALAEQRDDCPCPACAIKRALTDAIATGTGAVRISAVDLMQPRDDTDETPKH